MSDKQKLDGVPYVDVTVVFHGSKQAGPATMPKNVLSNQPLSMDGAVRINDVVAARLKEIGTFEGPIYSSILARALDTASILAVALGKAEDGIVGLPNFGQMGSDNPETGDIYIEGFESQTDAWKLWAEMGVAGILEIARRSGCNGQNVLAVSHRPTILGAYALANGTDDEQILHDLAYFCPLAKKPGFITFRVYDNGEYQTLVPESAYEQMEEEPSFNGMLAHICKAAVAAANNAGK